MLAPKPNSGATSSWPSKRSTSTLWLAPILSTNWPTARASSGRSSESTIGPLMSTSRSAKRWAAIPVSSSARLPLVSEMSFLSS